MIGGVGQIIGNAGADDGVGAEQGGIRRTMGGWGGRRGIGVEQGGIRWMMGGVGQMMEGWDGRRDWDGR